MTTARPLRHVAATLAALLALVATVLPAPGAAAPPLEQAVHRAQVVLGGAIADVSDAVAAVGGTIVAELPIVGATVAEIPADRLADVDRAPGVTAVEENVPVELQSSEEAEATAATHPADDQGPATLGADELWAAGVDGSGVGIAVLDTGVSEVDELSGRVIGGVDMTPEQDGVDAYGHGTPIAALAAGSSVGVAPGAHIVPVKIADRSGMTDIVRVLMGLEWIAYHADDLDIRVVNLSLGTTPIAQAFVDAAVQRLWDQGIVVVVAAGNDGPDSLGTPASNTHAITVGSTQGRDTASVDDDAIAPWSSDGYDADGREKPDLTGPGQSLVTVGAPGSWGYENHPESHLGDGRQRISGTSFTTGLLSGSAALLLDAHPSWTPDEVLGQLTASGRTVAGTPAPTPWLPSAVDTDSPVAANGDASEATFKDAFEELDKDELKAHRDAMKELWKVQKDAAKENGVEFDGSGWYGSGWYGSGWYGSGWYGSGWYGSGWYGSGWYGSGWYGSGWYGSGWYGSGWYGSGWYGSGWY